MNSLFELHDKIAVVTGGSGTLGKAICQALAQAGAIVVMIARDAEKLALAVEELHSAGSTAISIVADVLDKTSLLAAAEQVQERYGRVDILVNAAGGNRTEATAMTPQRPFFDLPQDALQWVVDLNLMGTLLPSQVFGAMMAQQQAGVIVNISSMASFRPLSRVVAYAGAKAAVNNFTQWLAVMMAMDYSPNIRVNAVAPGFFVGEQNYFLLYDENQTLTPRGQQIISHTPMGRFGDPQDLCGAILWLTSDASRFVTGIIVPVDGGFSAFSGV
jgi:NAD(P)-dependent dehydrogenase (short-subunit alcohol dehydrogenase family)